MLDVQNAVLGNELLVRRVLLPTVHTDVQPSLKSIQKHDDKVTALKVRIPGNAIDDICRQWSSHCSQGH